MMQAALVQASMKAMNDILAKSFSKTVKNKIMTDPAGSVCD